MTIAESIPEVARSPVTSETDGPQRFVFGNVDWAFYEEICRRTDDRRVFVTFYKGRLEIVTTSFLHELLSSLLTTMVGVLAEECGTKIIPAGRSTLRRPDLNEAAEPDASFYVANHGRMVGREEIILPDDPPPDLAIEIEVTRRLGVRRSIYQDVGVPEIWVYRAGDGLRVLAREPDGTYAWAGASATFPLLSLAEMSAVVRDGQGQDQTSFVKVFRRRVREALAQQRP